MGRFLLTSLAVAMLIVPYGGATATQVTAQGFGFDQAAWRMVTGDIRSQVDGGSGLNPEANKLAIDPATGQLYFVNALDDDVFRIDPTSGALTAFDTQFDEGLSAVQVFDDRLYIANDPDYGINDPALINVPLATPGAVGTETPTLVAIQDLERFPAGYDVLTGRIVTSSSEDLIFYRNQDPILNGGRVETTAFDDHNDTIYDAAFDAAGRLFMVTSRSVDPATGEVFESGNSIYEATFAFATNPISWSITETDVFDLSDRHGDLSGISALAINPVTGDVVIAAGKSDSLYIISSDFSVSAKLAEGVGIPDHFQASLAFSPDGSELFFYDSVSGGIEALGGFLTASFPSPVPGPAALGIFLAGLMPMLGRRRG